MSLTSSPITLPFAQWASDTPASLPLLNPPRSHSMAFTGTVPSSRTALPSDPLYLQVLAQNATLARRERLLLHSHDTYRLLIPQIIYSCITSMVCPVSPLPQEGEEGIFVLFTDVYHKRLQQCLTTWSSKSIF